LRQRRRFAILPTLPDITKKVCNFTRESLQKPSANRIADLGPGEILHTDLDLRMLPSVLYVEKGKRKRIDKINFLRLISLDMRLYSNNQIDKAKTN
jgi:hypothetical protein